jgi:hypothetical protein
MIPSTRFAILIPGCNRHARAAITDSGQHQQSSRNDCAAWPLQRNTPQSCPAANRQHWTGAARTPFPRCSRSAGVAVRCGRAFRIATRSYRPTGASGSVAGSPATISACGTDGSAGRRFEEGRELRRTAAGVLPGHSVRLRPDHQIGPQCRGLHARGQSSVDRAAIPAATSTALREPPKSRSGPKSAENSCSRHHLPLAPEVEQATYQSREPRLWLVSRPVARRVCGLADRGAICGTPLGDAIWANKGDGDLELT